ncbi:NAD(P)-dependent oxidoreductase [Ferrimonas pelagia]|uniref:NAD(P)-dependent oxidoreductase n=1 Tax=Ferrimonas pelagia TaxID=1177826 RepID=A0ABP9EPL2_9GAMM
MAMTTVAKTTVFITGASRGIGREIALACARQGNNVVIAAKSDTPHPKLAGTIHSVAQEVEDAGGQALAIKLDVREEAAVTAAMAHAAAHFGGIDVLVNNASAIQLSSVQDTEIKRFDLIHSINTRGTLVCSKAAIPYLKQSANGHIVTLSPPINLAPHWLGPYAPYTLTKYGMTLLTLGLAQELKADGVSCTTLWPQTTIATAAIEYALDPKLLKRSRTPAIMADAALAILTTDDQSLSGQSLVDEALLRERGVTDFEHYKVDPECEQLYRDLYLDR